MVDRGSYDPGWNDPPKLSYNNETTSKPRNNLNKRIPFSISSSIPNKSTETTNFTSPPLIPVDNINTPISVKDILSCQKAGAEVNIENLNEVVRILNGIVESSPELGKKGDDIKRRILTMDKMWRDGKLNNDVQLKMLQLARSLDLSDPTLADTIHKSLIVDYVNVVGSWMVGIKQLIFNCSAKLDLLSIDKEE